LRDNKRRIERGDGEEIERNGRRKTENRNKRERERKRKREGNRSGGNAPVESRRVSAAIVLRKIIERTTPLPQCGEDQTVAYPHNARRSEAKKMSLLLDEEELDE